MSGDASRVRARGPRAMAGLLVLVALVLLGGAFIAATVAAAVAAAEPSPSATGQVVDAGRSLYVANCASCHGPQGGGGVGPPLIGVGAAAADFYVRTGRMPPADPELPATRHEPVFTEQQIEAIVAYVASLGDGPDIPAVRGGGDIGAGWRLFVSNCAACHAARGAGNAIGGGYVAVELGSADGRTVLEAIRIGPGAMPRFSFSDDQGADLVAYLQYLRDEPHPGGLAIGSIGPVAEGFVAVLIGLPVLLVGARRLGDARRIATAGDDAGADAGADARSASPDEGPAG